MNKYVIHKHAIGCRHGDEMELLLPFGSQVLSVQMQNGIICMWECHPITEQGERFRRSFFIVGTGEQFHSFNQPLGTVQDGPFVWHVFERRHA